MVSSAVDEAFSGDDTTVTASQSQAAGSEEADGEKAERDDKGDAEQGARANPYPLGSAITQGDWTVTINSVDLDANADLTKENMYNEAPDAGTVYILVNMTAEYTGTDPEGDEAWATVDYVTADGNTIDGLDQALTAPDEFDSLETLYEGASTIGNSALQVPAETAAEGVLAVSPSAMGDKVFVAVK